jgi:predicted alpha/beta-fold hydrolase
MSSFLLRWSADLTHIDAQAVRESQSLKDMEIHLISPMFGYQSVEEYYEDASTHDAVARISLPTLCISVLDDPIALSDGIPLRAFSTSATVGLACSRHGGHIGWPDLSHGNRATWSEVAALQFFSAALRRLQRSDNEGTRINMT